MLEGSSADAGGTAPGRWQTTGLLLVYGSAIFVGASLLFVVQPMVGKLLLPKLGGAPAIWNTCLLFFQAMLLLGYLSAHLMTTRLQVGWQVAVFAAAVVGALATLPLDVPQSEVARLLAGTTPNRWLLSVLVTHVAPALLVVSMTSPLLQRWFARSSHPAAGDPYFLYAASNVGSLLALVAYPVVVERWLGAAEQARYWRDAFVVYGLLATAGGAAVWRLHASGHTGRAGVDGSVPSTVATSVPSWRQRGQWVLLAAVPSSLLMGVTTYVATDVAAMPVLWVIPLALYLVTFILAFMPRQVLSPYWSGRLGAMLAVCVGVMQVSGANEPATVILPTHLVMFFVTALFCHQRLASTRPSPTHLTDFYLMLSVGGVVGGLFNALVAPMAFPALIEYPLAMLVAMTMRATRPAERHESLGRALGFGAALAVVLFASLAVVDRLLPAPAPDGAGALQLALTERRMLLTFGVPACVVFSRRESRAAFAAGLGALLVCGAAYAWADPQTLWRGRNFYGTVSIVREELAGGTVTKMVHGNTIHGWQWADAARRGVPLTYYTAESGIGRVIDDRQRRSADPVRIGVVGLGAGTLAATLRLGDEATYYEINPQVVEHAEQHFTYLRDARDRGATVRVRVGDARLLLEAESLDAGRERYDILVVDAFSSDAIPVHLLTRECLQVYLSRLGPEGLLAVHITNRYLRLEPVMAALATASGLSGIVRFHDAGARGVDRRTGRTSSEWVVLARQPALLSTLLMAGGFAALHAEPGQRLWTDDYSNLLSVLALGR